MNNTNLSIKYKSETGKDRPDLERTETIQRSFIYDEEDIDFVEWKGGDWENYIEYIQWLEEKLIQLLKINQ